MGILYQTLEDCDNVDYVEANGPFLGNQRDRWLGRGYYYWDTFINSAHFWGRVSYLNAGKGYIIAHSEISLPPEKVLNLLEPSDLIMFAAWRDEYVKTFPKSKATIEKVLTHAENIMGENFPYIAIRAEFRDCINIQDYQDRIFPNGRAYLDLKPPIQICIKDRNVIGKDNFKVIYPECYMDNTLMSYNI